MSAAFRRIILLLSLSVNYNNIMRFNAGDPQQQAGQLLSYTMTLRYKASFPGKRSSHLDAQQYHYEELHGILRSSIRDKIEIGAGSAATH